MKKEKKSKHPFMYAQEGAGFKVVVFATSKRAADKYVKNQAISVHAYRGLKFVGKGEPSQSDQGSWAATVVEDVEVLRQRGYVAEERRSVAAFQRATAELEKKCGEAYMAAAKLKSMFDDMEEIPSEFQGIYNRTMKIMDRLGNAKQDAYQSKMETRRLK